MGKEMDVKQYYLRDLPSTPDAETNLVLMLTGLKPAEFTDAYDKVRAQFPNADIAGCTTAGEILETRISDNDCVITAISFNKTTVACASVDIDSPENSSTAGAQLAEKLQKQSTAPLKHVLILSDGLKVNGSHLVTALVNTFPSNVIITGGLAGDDGKFQETLTALSSSPKSGQIVGIGFYGDHIKTGHGCVGGWDPFGTERLITRSTDNVLYELDGKPALDLYKQYLGEHAEGLPATGLLFPLTVRTPNSDTTLVRTILGVDEKENSLTFAGNVPTGNYARFMRANFSRVVAGAEDAASKSLENRTNNPAQLAILVSCVGRKMILKQRTEEEVEAVREKLGPNTPITGFYSYGEISPLTPSASCELHNQTMTITTMWEE